MLWVGHKKGALVAGMSCQQVRVYNVFVRLSFRKPFFILLVWALAFGVSL